jgi:uncharacterized protein YoxC
MKLELAQLVAWAIQGSLLGIGTYAVKFLGKITETMEALKESIEALNLQVAVVIEKQSNHDKELSRLDNRVVRLEQSEE